MRSLPSADASDTMDTETLITFLTQHNAMRDLCITFNTTAWIGNQSLIKSELRLLCLRFSLYVMISNDSQSARNFCVMLLR